MIAAGSVFSILSYPPDGASFATRPRPDCAWSPVDLRLSHPRRPHGKLLCLMRLVHSCARRIARFDRHPHGRFLPSPSSSLYIPGAIQSLALRGVTRMICVGRLDMWTIVEFPENKYDAVSVALKAGRRAGRGGGGGVINITALT